MLGSLHSIQILHLLVVKSFSLLLHFPGIFLLLFQFAFNGFDFRGLIIDEGENKGLWKLVKEPQIPMNGWTGPLTPNSTETHYEAWFEFGCGGGGCLFRIDEDESEHHNVALAPANAARLKAMAEQIDVFTKGAFSPERGTPQLELACAAAQGAYHGFWGPWIE